MKMASRRLRVVVWVGTFAVLTGLGASAGLAAQSPQAAPARPVVAKPVSTTLALQVTDGLGVPLPDVRVVVTGALSRNGSTGADGNVRFATMKVGTYRLRFERDGFFTLEREVVVRAGEGPVIDVVLNPAPPPPKPPEPPPPPPPPPAKTLGPPGEVKVLDIPAFLDRNLIGSRDGRKESSLGCAATGRATLYQLRDPWATQAHPDADEWLYVVAGQGTLRAGSVDQHLQAGTFVLVPHTVEHSITPASRTPLILVSVVTGPECESP
jgi:mannose-6-phosphate isomerase-like protein (cupin superfamily)